MCGNVLCGRFDPAKPFFTADGSFWTNSTSELLATTTEADGLGRTRSRCSSEGYESVALVPLRAAGETFGLLQLNDRRRGRFSPGKITLLERLADSLALGLAHRQAQETLCESKLRLERAVQAGNVGLWEWDLCADRVLHSLESAAAESATRTKNSRTILPRGRVASIPMTSTAASRASGPSSRNLGRTSASNSATVMRTARIDRFLRKLHWQWTTRVKRRGCSVRTSTSLTANRRRRPCAVSEERFRDLAELLPQTIYEADPRAV